MSWWIRSGTKEIKRPRQQPRGKEECVFLCVFVYVSLLCSAIAASSATFALTQLVLAKHWTRPVYSTLPPVGLLQQLPNESGHRSRRWMENSSSGVFECAINRICWCRASLSLSLSARSSQPATVPGVGGGAGEVGRVGLPESTGGQGRIDWLALPTTAQHRGETPKALQIKVCWSLWGRSVLQVKLFYSNQQHF